MEVSVRGPDGATHLILCTGIDCLNSGIHEIFTFFVGPQLSKSRIGLGADLLSIDANYDSESGQVKVRAEFSSSSTLTKLSISYSVSILAELPLY